MQAEKRRCGFTLVELLVAVALMVVLITTVTVVYTQASHVFSRVDAEGETLSELRSAIELMTRDFTNCLKTHEMEFYNDIDANGYYNDGDERVKPADAKADAGRGVIKGTKEVNAGGVRKWEMDEGTALPYHHALTIVHRSYEHSGRGKRHTDAIYFRSIGPVPVDVGGEQLETDFLVSYTLDTTFSELPTLHRRIMWLKRDATGKLVKTGGKLEVDTPVDDPLLVNVTEFNVEILLPDPEFKDISNTDPRLTKNLPHFRHYLYDEGAGKQKNADHVFEAYYGDRKRTITPLGKLPAVTGFYLEKDTAPYQHIQHFRFLGPGDPVFLIDYQGADPKDPALLGKEYTVGDVVYEDLFKTSIIRFRENVPYRALNNIYSDVQFRAAFLPPGIKITMRIQDRDRGIERTVRRIFRLPRR